MVQRPGATSGRPGTHEDRGMRRSRYLMAAMFLAASFTAYGDGYLPLPCEGLPDADHLRCPTPYVELVPDRHDDIFARNFLCRETNYNLGAVRGGGCGTSYMDGWSLPPGVSAIPVAQVDYRGEIMEHVVHPCYLDIARRNTLEGITPEDYAALLLVIAANSVEEMVQQVTTLVAQLETLEERSMVYNMGRMLCIRSAREG